MDAERSGVPCCSRQLCLSRRPNDTPGTLRAAWGDLQQVKVIYKDRYQGAGEQVAVMELVAADELFATTC